MVDQKVYEKLKEKFGPFASWAIWNPPEDGKPASNTYNIDYFSNPAILSDLKTDYAIIGLNAAVRTDTTLRVWGNFHSKDEKEHRQRDYKLRYALWDTPYWGSYITDIIKGYPETNSNCVIKKYKSDAGFRKEVFDTFKEEIEIIGSPTLIVLGNAANTILKKMKKEFGYDFHNVEIIQIPHYSMYCSKEDYRTKVSKILPGISEDVLF